MFYVGNQYIPVEPYCFNTVSANDHIVHRLTSGIIIFTSKRMPLLRPSKSPKMEKSMKFSMEYQTGSMKVMHSHTDILTCPCIHSFKPANPSVSFLAQQKRFLHPTKPSGGLRRGNIWLIYKLMTLEFTALNTHCTEMTSTPPQYLSPTQK